MKKFMVAASTMALFGSVFVAQAPIAEAGSVTALCADVEAVWARGSGQDLGEDEAQRFRSQLDVRVPADAGLTVNLYELGTDKADGGYGGYSYDAVNVSPWNGNLFGAFFSGGSAFDYGRSVDGGIGELYNYLQERKARCGSARFVLGGYSQGGHVVSEALVKVNAEDPGLLDFIDFSAMFGDPKLNLPEGRGWNPPACEGKEYSPWRRIVPNCDTDGGSLGGREPVYLPSSVQDKAGLWCNDVDFVCGSSKTMSNAGHYTYATNGTIDAGVREIAERLSKTLPPDKAAAVNVGILNIGEGTAGLDVAFVIDTTGSMNYGIEQARAFARTAAGTIRDLRGRVALVAYRDAGDEYTAKVFTPLDDDMTTFQVQLDTLATSGGGDTPEALMHALMTTLNSLDWKPGATKAAVVLTDATYHDPDAVDGATLSQVAVRALQIDPVNVYPVVPAYLAAEYQGLADLTSGEVIVNEGDTAASLTAALTKIKNRPVPSLPLTDYYTQPGHTIRFDASKSYVADSTITSYEWDFNGDGVFEQSTADPIVTRQYDDAFDGVMQVRVTAADGGLANASAFVHVATEGPSAGKPAAARDLTANVLSTVGGVSTVRLSWAESDGLSKHWAVSLNGVQLGLTDPNLLSVDITDVERAEDVTLGVRGVTADNVIGATATVIVPKATITKYAFDGFGSPVDNLPMVNALQAGRAVPVKFGLGGDYGLGILASDSPSSIQVSCETQAELDEVEITSTAGVSTLTYDASIGRYNYVWKTDKAWAGTCRMLSLTLDDGSTHQALFRLRL